MNRRKKLFLTYKCIESKFKSNNSLLNAYKRFNRTDIPPTLQGEQTELMELKKELIMQMVDTFQEYEIECIYFYSLQLLTDSEIASLYGTTKEVITYILGQRSN